MFFKKISLSRFSVKRTDLSAVTISLAAGGGGEQPYHFGTDVPGTVR